MFEKTATLFVAAAGIALFSAAGAANGNPVSDCQTREWRNGYDIGTKTICGGYSPDGYYQTTTTYCYENGDCTTYED
jgi:hypothetical protein